MRSRAVSGYTEAQVEAALRAPGGQYGRRFELQDKDGNLRAPLHAADDRANPRPGEVTAATTTFDIDRAVRGGLDLSMIPPADTELAAALRDGPFQFRVASFFSWRMPDGGTAEVPTGVYLWQEPERQPGPVESWSVQMGDLTQIVDLDGPEPFPNVFRARIGERYTDRIGAVWQEAGFSDLSRIERSDARLTVEHSWSAQVGGDKLVRVPDRSTGALTWQWVRLENTTQKWSGVLSYLGDAIGYEAAHVDVEGLPVSRPARDYSVVDPEFVFDSGAQSITVVPVQLKSNPGAAVNRVDAIMSEAENAAVAQSVTVRLHDLFPDHPLTRDRIGFEIKGLLPSVDAPNLNQLVAAARRELSDRMSYYRYAELRTMAWPFFEALDPVGIRIDGDPGLGSTGLFQHRGWALDHFTGRQSNDVRRLYRVV